MTKEGLLIWVGVAIALSPFLGLPTSWLSWILPVLGLMCASMAFLLRRRAHAFLSATQPLNDSQAAN